MSVLIKGMEMPTSCAFCRFNGAYCYAKGDEDAHSTLPCPLVPVPPHGDLIDRDGAVRDLRMDYAYAAAKIVALQPTIIPAEEVT